MSISSENQRVSGETAQDILDRSPLSHYQIWAIATLMGVNGLDGFDAFAINFASPGIAADWGVEKDALGFIKSMNLIGMGFGALLIAPLADKIGRRPVIIWCVALMALTMFASAFVTSVVPLSVLRVLTGLGIGAMLASVTATSAEFSNAKWRATCVSVSATGYLLGAVLGGLVSAELLEIYSWRSIFIFGGVASALYLPIIAWRIPETISFLAQRQRPGDLDRVNGIFSRMGHGPASRLGDLPQKQRFVISALFAPDIARITIVVTLAYFFQVITFYYFVGWVPDILVDLGYTQSDAARILTVANLAGTVGALSIGWLSGKFGITWPTCFAAVAGGLCVYGFGDTQSGMTRFVVFGAGAGFFLNAAIVMMYAFIARAFPTHIRALGAGFVLGVGRAGGVLGPILGGVLFQAGFSTGSTSLMMAGGAFLCALMVLFIAPALRRREQSS